MADRITGPFQRPMTVNEYLTGFLPVTRAMLDRRLAEVWDALTSTNEMIHYLEERMTTAEDAAYARVPELVGLIRAEFASLHQQLDAALADQGAAVDAAVSSALTTDSAADAVRINGLIDELASVLPAAVPDAPAVPDVPVPDPGQPAELPTDEAPADQPA